MIKLGQKIKEENFSGKLLPDTTDGKEHVSFDETVWNKGRFEALQHIYR